jgi:uncharacterized protein YdeI (YjbR/CyaY-like superfamily)
MTTVSASTAAQWRDWLARHSRSEREVWLVIFHKDADTPSVRYHEAIEQALCFGWIDSHHRKRDAHSSELRFTPRTPRSRWSATNRERAARLIDAGLMTGQGRSAIDLARSKGTWDATS